MKIKHLELEVKLKELENEQIKLNINYVITKKEITQVQPKIQDHQDEYQGELPGYSS